VFILQIVQVAVNVYCTEHANHHAAKPNRCQYSKKCREFRHVT